MTLHNIHEDFWNYFNEIAFNDCEFNKAFKKRKASDKSWYDLSLNINEAHLCLRHNIKENCLKVEMYIENNLEFFNYMIENKLEIEKKYGAPLNIEKKKNKKVKQIYDKFNFYDEDKKENWKEYVEWLKRSSLKLKCIAEEFMENFKKEKYYIKEINSYKESRHDILEEFNQLTDLDLYNLPNNYEYEGKKKEKSNPIIKNGVKIYKRDKNIARNALVHAKYSCEVDNSHYTFIRRTINLKYTETHHLVPLAYSDNFNVSLDVEENIVSLCSNCHNNLHYGKDFEYILKKLYYDRKENLLNVGINISFEELLNMY